MTVTGSVFTEDCVTPLPGATLDVWQADVEGAYDMADAAYPFRALVTADAEGAYRYTTLMPGRYLNGGQYRPAHIHHIVAAEGHRSLTTQLYFEDDPFLDVDPWAVPELTRAANDDGEGGLIVRWDIVLATSA